MPRILYASISVASLLSSDDVNRFLALASRRLLGWQHIDLSEARGLELFSGCPLAKNLVAVEKLPFCQNSRNLGNVIGHEIEDRRS